MTTAALRGFLVRLDDQLENLDRFLWEPVARTAEEAEEQQRRQPALLRRLQHYVATLNGNMTQNPRYYVRDAAEQEQPPRDPRERRQLAENPPPGFPHEQGREGQARQRSPRRPPREPTTTTALQGGGGATAVVQQGRGRTDEAGTRDPSPRRRTQSPRRRRRRPAPVQEWRGRQPVRVLDLVIIIGGLVCWAFLAYRHNQKYNTFVTLYLVYYACIVPHIIWIWTDRRLDIFSFF